MHRSGYRSRGFSLLELGIVLIVLSLLLSGAMSVVNQNLRIQKQTELKNRLDAIESALLAYRKARGYLPCPGDITLAEDNADFAFQGGAAGNCLSAGITANWNDAAHGAYYAVGGSLPANTLGLPEQYAYDPWGGRFLYFVDYRATTAAEFTKFASGANTAGILINDESGNAINSNAILAIISTGPNKNGAYVASGSQRATGTNTNENINNVSAGSLTTRATFYAHRQTTAAGNVLNSFDDTVRYYTVQHIASGSDAAIERP